MSKAKRKPPPKPLTGQFRPYDLYKAYEGADLLPLQINPDTPYWDVISQFPCGDGLFEFLMKELCGDLEGRLTDVVSELDTITRQLMHVSARAEEMTLQ